MRFEHWTSSIRPNRFIKVADDTDYPSTWFDMAHHKSLGIIAEAMKNRLKSGSSDTR